MLAEKEKNELSNEELSSIVETAARNGAIEGVREANSSSQKGKISPLLTMLLRDAILVVVLVVATMLVVKTALNPLSSLSSLLEKNTPVEDHDMTISNNGIFGYTVADFAEAILGKAEQQSSLQIYTREISEVTTITQAGLANLQIFSKYQLITYHGTAVYTVDMSAITDEDIVLDVETQTITIKIPQAKLEPINIPSENIEFGDVNKGLLAIGQLSLEPKELAKVETEAKSKMMEKLEQDKTIEDANRFARLSILEMYQPIVKSVAKNCSLVVEIKA